jgi:hypothetical protein
MILKNEEISHLILLELILIECDLKSLLIGLLTQIASLKMYMFINIYSFIIFLITSQIILPSLLNIQAFFMKMILTIFFESFCIYFSSSSKDHTPIDFLFLLFISHNTKVG